MQMFTRISLNSLNFAFQKEEEKKPQSDVIINIPV